MSTADIIEIGQLVQRWGLARDQGRWPVLEDCYTPDGEMHVTWYSGSAKGFVEASRKTFRQEGPRTKHLIGTPVIELNGDRALAETTIQILGRAVISGVAVDNLSYARFIDRIVRHAGQWKIATRTAVYEKDRFDPVIPGPAFDRLMAETDFSAVPEAYRFIGHRLLDMGKALMPGILTDGSPAAEAYRTESEAWLAADRQVFTNR